MEELEKKRVVELKEMAKKAGIRAYSKMRKRDLIESLKEFLAETSQVRKKRKTRGKKEKPLSSPVCTDLHEADAPSTLKEKMPDREKMPDARFVTPSEKISSVGERAEEEALPSSYPGKRLLVVPRDPEWVYIFWEIGNEELEKAKDEFGAGREVLKVYHGETQARAVLVSTEVQLKQGKYYARVPSSGGVVRVEVGIEKEDGNFYPVLGSSHVPTIPAGHRGGEVQVRFMTVPFDVPLTELKQRGTLVTSTEVAQPVQVLSEKEFRNIYGDLPWSDRT